MFEDMSWGMFEKTGSIEQYLLYKEFQNIKKSSDELGLYKDNGHSPASQEGFRA